MSHRGVEITLGRLATDEALRQRFQENPARTLSELTALGVELSSIELGALAALEPVALQRFALALDARLQKATLASAPDLIEPLRADTARDQEGRQP